MSTNRPVPTHWTIPPASDETWTDGTEGIVTRRFRIETATGVISTPTAPGQLRHEPLPPDHQPSYEAAAFALLTRFMDRSHNGGHAIQIDRPSLRARHYHNWLRDVKHANLPPLTKSAAEVTPKFNDNL